MNNPFTFGGPVAPNDFYGRRDSIDFIMDRLYGHSRSSIALWGDRRVGKSSLMHYLFQPALRQQWLDDSSQHIMIFIDCQMFTRFDQQLLWQEVLEQMAGVVHGTDLLPRVEAVLAEDEISERSLRSLLRTMHGNGQTVTLLLDEFSHLVWLAAGEERTKLQAMLSFLRTLITAVSPPSPAGAHPRPLALVTSTRRPLDEVCAPAYQEESGGSPFHNPFVFERLKPFEAEGVYALLESRLKGTAVRFSRKEIDHLLATAGRHPILVQSYGSELYTAKQEAASEIADFEEVDAIFFERNRQHFHEFWNYSSKIEKDLLANIARQEIDWERLAPIQVRARQQLIERGLMLEKNQLFSPLFASWLQLNLPELASAEAEPGHLDRVRLFNVIDAHFNEGELRELCFSLGVEYDSLPGDGKRDRARELVELMRRYGRMDDLLEAVVTKRPHLKELREKNR